MAHELSVTRYINAAPEFVWEVMTERMEDWWCPIPWRTEIVRLDRHPGGTSVLRMLGPNGEVNEHPGFEGTRYTATARHWTPESTLHHKEMGFEEGWGKVADQLKTLCE
jgi:uncharacterized protein YndB with AHSA1/START domain